MSDDDGVPGHAADEPTAMWDESALLALGLDKPKEDSRREPTGGSPISVELRPATAGAATGPRKAQSPIVAWVVTIAVALVVGVAVYYLVRALR